MGDTTFNIGSQQGDSISNVAGDQINIDTGHSPEPSRDGVSATVLFLVQMLMNAQLRDRAPQA